MRYKFFSFTLVIITIFLSIIDVHALEIVDLNPTIQIGETKDIELYANIPSNTKQIDFILSFLSYDATGTFESSIGTLTNNGITHSISFDKPIEGRVKLGVVKIKVSNNTKIDTSTINLYNANAISKDNIKTKLNNQSIKINIVEEKDESTTNLLTSISSNIVDISLEPNKFVYDISVSNEVDKLDLTAKAIDETYKIDISNQEIKEEKNQIYITVSKENIIEKYTINVTKTPKDNIIEEVKETKKNEVSKIVNKNFKSGWTNVIIGLIIVFIIGLFMLRKK